MAEYTYKGIIIDPNSEEAKNAIGKEVYFEAKPFLCLKAANEKLASNLGILVEVYKDSINPFCVKGKSGSYKYPCIIEKKEEPKPEYVPFKNRTEFIKAYKSVETKKLRDETTYLSKHGMWLRQKCDSEDSMILSISPDGVFVLDTFYTWELLIKDFLFLDGSPCGKLVEVEHE